MPLFGLSNHVKIDVNARLWIATVFVAMIIDDSDIFVTEIVNSSEIFVAEIMDNSDFLL